MTGKTDPIPSFTLMKDRTYHIRYLTPMTGRTDPIRQTEPSLQGPGG